MKQFLLLIILFAVSCYSQSDRAVTVRSSFDPEAKYTTETRQFTNGTIEYIASDEILHKLKQRRIENPMPVQLDLTFKTIMKTGKLRKDGFFPITLLFVEKGNFANFPDDMVIYGKCSPGDLPILDSISSIKLYSAEKNSILAQMQAVFSQISIPEKTAKIGESFSFDIPLNMPMPGKNIEMDIKCTYTLKKIIGDIAHFDIITDFSLKHGVESSNTQIKGKGSGKLLYNWKLNYNQKYEIQSNIEMSINADEIELKVNITQGSIISVSLEKNN